MRFLYQPIIPPRMVAMGFQSRRSESLVLCGRTEAANAITEVFDEKSGRFDAACVPIAKKLRSILALDDPDQSALRIVDHLRRRFAGFKLCAYFLQASSKRFDCCPVAEQSAPAACT